MSDRKADIENREYREWVAAVRYGDSKKEAVRVKCIKRFKPKSLVDFDQFAVVSVKTNTWSAGKEFVYYDALVEGLGVNVRAAELSRKTTTSNRSQADKDKVNFLLGKMRIDPLATSDETGASDVGDAQPNSFERQEQRKRDAFKETNLDIGATMLSRLRGKIDESHLTKVANRTGKKESTATIKQKRMKSPDHDPIEKQSKKKKTESKAKQIAENDWSQKLASSSHFIPRIQVAGKSISNGTISSDISTDDVPSESERQPLKDKDKTSHKEQPSTSNSTPKVSSTSKHTPISSKSFSQVFAEPRRQVEKSPERSSSPAPATPAVFMNNNQRGAAIITHSPSPCTSSPIPDVNKEGGNSKNRNNFKSVNDIQNSDSECINCGKIWEEVQKMKTKLEDIDSHIIALLQERVDLSQVRTGHGSNTGAVCYGRVVTGGKVELGSNFFCSKPAWVTMNTCEKMTDWCVAILRGTFGVEEAMMYRCIPRYTDLKAFPAEFLSIAKDYYEAYINRRIEELKCEVEAGMERDTTVADSPEPNSKDPNVDDPAEHSAASLLKFFRDNKKTLLKQLGATLSDRANSMHRIWIRRQASKGVQIEPRVKAPPRTQQTTPKPKKRALKKILTEPKPTLNEGTPIQKEVPASNFPTPPSGRSSNNTRETPNNSHHPAASPVTPLNSTSGNLEPCNKSGTAAASINRSWSNLQKKGKRKPQFRRALTSSFSPVRYDSEDSADTISSASDSDDDSKHGDDSSGGNDFCDGIDELTEKTLDDEDKILTCSSATSSDDDGEEEQEPKHNNKEDLLNGEALHSQPLENSLPVIHDAAFVDLENGKTYATMKTIDSSAF